MSSVRYRKLPGRRRGFIIGASLWMGPDHILSVRSLRIREEYKRFHFRDVQGIAVARAPRFYFSTAHLLAVLAWLGSYFLAVQFRTRDGWMLWVVLALMFAAWVGISLRWSCRCRIYTAVSREELPSIARIWTARKFLDQVVPKIAELQGTAPANWAEAAEEIAPAISGPAPVAATPENPSPHAKVHTLTADLFIATLFANAVANVLALHSSSPAANWSQIGFGLTLLGETVLLFIQYYRGVLLKPMQRLAIVNLIAIGTMYYVRQMVYSFKAGASQPGADLKIPTFYAGDALTRGIEAGVCAALGLAGVAIIALYKKPR